MTEDKQAIKQAIIDRALELRRTAIPMKQALRDIDRYVEQHMLNLIPPSLRVILEAIHPDMDEKTGNAKKRAGPIPEDEFRRDMTKLSLAESRDIEDSWDRQCKRYRGKIQALLAVDLSEHPAIADILGPVKDL